MAGCSVWAPRATPRVITAAATAAAAQVGAEFRGVWNVGRGIMNVTHGAAEFPGAEDKVPTLLAHSPTHVLTHV